jgi:hypothetical protein
VARLRREHERPARQRQQAGDAKSCSGSEHQLRRVGETVAAAKADEIVRLKARQGTGGRLKVIDHIHHIKSELGLQRAGIDRPAAVGEFGPAFGDGAGHRDDRGLDGAPERLCRKERR